MHVLLNILEGIQHDKVMYKQQKIASASEGAQRKSILNS